MNAPTVPNPGQHQSTDYQQPTDYQQHTGPQSYASGPVPRAEEDPGKVLGIVSLVATLSTFLGFNFLGPIVGIVTGYMARNRSRQAGYADNEMGKWGFILGIVFLSLAALGGLLGLGVAGAAGLFGLLGA